MADAGPPVPPTPPTVQAPQAPQAPQPPTQSVQSPILQAQPIQPFHVPQLSWSHVKPKFARKPMKMQKCILLE